MNQAAPAAGHTIDDISGGMSASFAKTVSDQDIVAFADLSGDHNPVHLDQVYAETTIFKGRIAHGMLSAAFISTVLGTKLPGAGCIYLAQSLKFRAPVKVGDTVEATVTVTAVDQERRQVTLETRCAVGETVVIDGEAQMMVPAGSKAAAAA